MRVLRSFLLALVFFTRIPIRSPRAPSAEDWGRSMAAAPAVGLLIGLLLILAAALLDTFPASIAAALLVIIWVCVTGALHVDGFADCADAWIGGHGDRTRTLAILKDPRSGPIGVTAVVLLLLAKFAAIEALLESGAYLALVVAPVVGRAAMILMLLRLPYVRSGGIGQHHAEHLPRKVALTVLAVCAVATIALGGSRGVLAVALAVAFAVLLVGALRARLGGCTGDSLGAACESTELLVLLGFAM